MNYPQGINKNQKTIFYNNRGMSFESDINISNEYYLLNKIAVIYKKPTPITIVDVDYPSRREAVITKAYFKTASTTDYNGIYKGKYIDFEAKETKNKKGFPLSNIHKHQIDHLNNINFHGGIGFIIVKFNHQDKIYLLDITYLLKFINEEKKSIIPIQYFENNGHLINQKYNPRIDYIETVNNVYFKEENL